MAAPVINNVQSASSHTLMNYNVPASGADKVLIVVVTNEDTNAAFDLTGVTFGSDVLSLVDHVEDTSLSYQYIHVFQKINPTVQMADIAVGYVNSSNIRFQTIAFYLTGADQTAPNGVAGKDQDDSPFTISLSPIREALLLGLWTHGGGNLWTPGALYTSVYSAFLASHSTLIEQRSVASAGTYDVDASVTTPSRPVGMAIAYLPPDAGGGGTNYNLDNVDSYSVTASSVDDLTVTAGGTNVQLDNVDSISTTVSSVDTLTASLTLATTDSYSTTVSSSPEMGTVRDLSSIDSYSLTVSEESNLTSVSPISLENVDSVSTTVSDEPVMVTNRTLVDIPSISASISSVDLLSVSFAMNTTDSYSLTVSEESDFGGSISLVSVDSVSETYSSVDSPTVSRELASVDSVSFTYSSSDAVLLNATLVSVDSYSLTVSERSSIPPREYSKAFLQYYKWMTGHAPFYPR